MMGVAAPAYTTSILFRTKCVDGITVNEEVLAHYMETTVGIHCYSTKSYCGL